MNAYWNIGSLFLGEGNAALFNDWAACADGFSPLGPSFWRSEQYVNIYLAVRWGVMIRDASEGSLLKCTVIGITRILPHHKSNSFHFQLWFQFAHGSKDDEVGRYCLFTGSCAWWVACDAHCCGFYVKSNSFVITYALHIAKPCIQKAYTLCRN